MNGFLTVLAIIGILILIAIFLYNQLVSFRQTCQRSWSDITVQLKQRLNLIPNLIETVKGYTKHENKTLNAVVKAREKSVDAKNLQDQMNADHLLMSSLRQLFALSESYPDLKASQNFIALQKELASIEDKISASRRFYNDACAQYNTALEQFPSILVAKTMAFKKMEYYTVENSVFETMSEPQKINF